MIVEAQCIVPSGDNKSNGPTALFTKTVQYSGNRLAVDVTVPAGNAFTLVAKSNAATASSRRSAAPCENGIQITGGKVRFTAPGSVPYSVTVIDAAGGSVRRFSGDSSRHGVIETAELRPGLYLIEIRSPEARVSRKFLVR